MRSRKVLKFLDNLESYLCQILLVFFVCLLFLQVVLRLVFSLMDTLSHYIAFFEHYDFIDDLRENIDNWEKNQLKIIIEQGIIEGEFKTPSDLDVALETIIMLLKGMELTYFLKENPRKTNPQVEKVAEILIHGVTR